MNKVRNYGIALLVLIWASLACFAWFGPKETVSDWERRALDQLPKFSWETFLDGKFVESFESYSLDQFPLRNRFRQLKAITHYYLFQQKDNNQIYVADGYAAKMEYQLDEKSVNHALGQFQKVYDRYLKENGCQVYAAVIPDKGYYLAEKNGYLSMDYEKLFSMVQAGMPWAEHIDITDCLTVKDYYYTDTHWRQENLFPTAQKLSEAMGLTAPKAEDFKKTELERPFYGVYYGQAALPMGAEPMYILESNLLKDSTVFNYTTGKTAPVYDMEKLYSKDQYEVFLSGSQSLLRIDNPKGKSGKHLIVFRDSFGSSLTPLLTQDYETVTLVDIRYLHPMLLGNFIQFDSQDVLFLYSTSVLNNSETIK